MQWGTGLARGSGQEGRTGRGPSWPLWEVRPQLPPSRLQEQVVPSVAGTCGCCGPGALGVGHVSEVWPREELGCKGPCPPP